MAKRFVVERSAGDKVELDADSAVQSKNDTRVTFYLGGVDEDDAVGSFINVQAWYVKPPEPAA
jgi:hypothetical protein